MYSAHGTPSIYKRWYKKRMHEKTVSEVHGVDKRGSIDMENRYQRLLHTFFITACYTPYTTIFISNCWTFIGIVDVVLKRSEVVIIYALRSASKGTKKKSGMAMKSMFTFYNKRTWENIQLHIGSIYEKLLPLRKWFKIYFSQFQTISCNS